MRKQYIDNLRWAIILLLIPFHAAQAFKTWDEPNYIVCGPNQAISSIIVFFGPFVMQLLFLFAGMSMRYALKKRTYAQFATERVKRLIVPLVFGLIVLVPPMCYLADKFHTGYSGSFFRHYIKFFTVITDMSGADGGFSFGQFWFLLYLFILSFVLLVIIILQKKLFSGQDQQKNNHCSGSKQILLLIGVISLGLPLPLISELLSVGGKSFVEFLYFLLIGYYIFTREDVAEVVKKYGIVFLAVGVISGALNVYLFVFSGADYPVMNTIAKYLCEWFMVIGLLGVGTRFLNRDNAVTRYFTNISYPFYSFHFVFVILFQYLFSDVFNGSISLLYVIPVILSFVATIACCQITLSIPALSFLVGVKPKLGLSIPQRIANMYIRLLHGWNTERKSFEQSELNRIKNEKAEEQLVTGLIEDQNRLKEMRLGVSDMAYAGCEVIAVYNALKLLGQEHKLSELISRAEKNGALMRKGKWGTNPFSLERLCPNDGVSFQRIKKQPSEPGIYIISFWNSRRLKNGVHTICVQIDEEDIKTYNYSSEMPLKNKPFITAYAIKKR